MEQDANLTQQDSILMVQDANLTDLDGYLINMELCRLAFMWKGERPKSKTAFFEKILEGCFVER